MPIIERKIIPDSIVYTDCWKGYNALDITDFKHYRINHSELFADKKNHINGIENFWSQAKRHMRKFNGIPKEHFALYLKECEWRFNNPNPKHQLKQLKQWVKKYKINYLGQPQRQILHDAKSLALFLYLLLLYSHSSNDSRGHAWYALYSVHFYLR
jgi:transposase-like protein